jgi:hypothetical protein
LPFVTITGRTIDSNGTPVPNVSIKINETTWSSSTGFNHYYPGTKLSDSNGNFSFVIPGYTYPITLTPPANATGVGATNYSNVDLSTNQNKDFIVVGTLVGSHLTLSAQISGEGSLNNITQPPSFSCSSPTTICTSSFGAGTKLTLSATPMNFYMFAGWSGGCSSFNGNGDCLITLNKNTYLTATFNPIPLLQIGGDPTVYQSLQTAYATTNEGSQLKVRNVTFSESLSLNRPINIAIHGGLDNDFTTVNGFTSLNGVLTLQKGSLVVDRLQIQ